jgi:hypothetical protein
MPVPEKKLMIKEEMIPNLKNLFLKKGQEDKRQQENLDKNVVSQVLDILKEKLMNNLKKMPSMYTTYSGKPSHG